MTRTLLVFCLAVSPALAADKPASAPHGGHVAAFAACAKACGECAMVCDMCSTHCANMIADGKKGHLATLNTCRDCATVCGSAACVTARGGPFSDLICAACADCCKRCGDACEAHKGDAEMEKCAAECRKCEKACRAMLVHGNPEKH